MERILIAPESVAHPDPEDGPMESFLMLSIKVSVSPLTQRVYIIA